MADLARKYKSLYSSTSNSFGTGEAVTITPNSVVGLPTDTEIVLTFDRVNSGGTATPSLMERIKGTISGGNFVVASGGRGYDGTTEQSHTSPVVEMIWNAKDWNDVVDAFVAEHTQAGGLHTKGMTNASLVTPTVTSPKIITSINDTNGNELMKVTATASAVNEITVANAATGSDPVWSATGGDTNIGWSFKPKGTGVFKVKTTASIQVVAAGTDTATGDSKFFFRIPPELNGMDLVAVSACVATAGTTGTTDVQIHRVRSATPVDMLSTKITIDSGEVDTATAATAAVVNTSNDDVQTSDQIHVDIDAVSTTAAKGLVVNLQFALP
jgi:hypothetical protein